MSSTVVGHPHRSLHPLSLDLDNGTDRTKCVTDNWVGRLNGAICGWCGISQERL